MCELYYVFLRAGNGDILHCVAKVNLFHGDTESMLDRLAAAEVTNQGWDH